MALRNAAVCFCVVSFAFMGLYAHGAPSEEHFHFLQNSQIKAGVDLSKGGSIGFLSAASNDISVINIHDFGREVQLSFYGGPNGYDGCDWSGHPWPWNPIGAGDAFGHTAQVLNITNLPNGGLHVFSRPLQWACNNVQCECLFEKKIWLEDSAVWVEATLHNFRSDHTDYGKFGQELPACYTNGFLPRLTCYTGSAPFTGAPLTNWDNAGGPPWTPGHITCTEHWAAFVDPSTSFGMGLFRPDWDVFYTGFSGKKGSGGPYDPQTGYIAGDGCGSGIDLKWDQTFTYTYALVLGDLPTIRSFVASKKSMITNDCGGYAGERRNLTAGQPLEAKL